MTEHMLEEIAKKTGFCELVYNNPGWTCFFLSTNEECDMRYSDGDKYVQSGKAEDAVKGAMSEVVRRDGFCGECTYFRAFIGNERGAGFCDCAGSGHSMSRKYNKLFCRCFKRG